MYSTVPPFVNIQLLYRRESNLVILSSPVTKIMYGYYWAYRFRVKRKEISSSAPGLGVMTHRECHVDHPFPAMWLGNVWEPAPPPRSTGQSRLFNPCFLGLNLRHRNVVTWTCDWLFWFSFITPSATSRLEHRVSIFPFFSIIAFFGGMPFAQLCFQSELL